MTEAYFLRDMYLSEDDDPGDYSVYCPGGREDWRLFAEAATYLRVFPDSSLLVPATNRNIGEYSLDQVAEFDSTVGRALLDIVLASNEQSVPKTDFYSKQIPAVDCCKDAEQRFAEAIVDSSGGYRTLVRNEYNEPLILQKTDGIMSGLLLQSVVIDNIPYPPGCIVTLDTAVRPFMRSEITSADILRMGVMRMSLFGIDPKEREKIMERDYASSFRHAYFIQSASIEEIVDQVTAT